MAEASWFIETNYYAVPARVTVLPRRQGENPRAERRRRARELEEARHKSPVGGSRVSVWGVFSTELSAHGQRDPLGVPVVWQHTCCELPDADGHVYPVCGMSPIECAGTEWW